MKFILLVILAGHSVHIGKNFENVFDNSDWYLYPFQKDEQKLYIEHIRVDFKIAKSNKNSFLIFTGGQSRKEAFFQE